MDIEIESITFQSGRQALPDIVKQSANTIADVGSTVLAESFGQFLTEIGEMLEGAPASVGPFVMDEMELSVSIGATGSFRIASSTATASLKMILRRPRETGPPRP